MLLKYKSGLYIGFFYSFFFLFLILLFFFMKGESYAACPPDAPLATGLHSGQCSSNPCTDSRYPVCSNASPSSYFCQESCSSPPPPPPSDPGCDPALGTCACSVNADCGPCEVCSGLSFTCVWSCSSGQTCSGGTCVNPPPPPPASTPPPAPPPPPPPPPPPADPCASACGGASCASCGGGYCCGGAVCVGGGGGCCPSNAPYLCGGGCYSEPCSAPPPPPSGGGCGSGTPTGDSNPSWACCPAGSPNYCGSGVCSAGSCGGGSAPPPAPPPPPPSGGSCNGIAYCSGTSQCVQYPDLGCVEYCDLNDPACGGSGGGSAPPPPPPPASSCTGSGQISCGGSCWSSTCTGTLSCSASGTPVCTVPPVTCGSGQVTSCDGRSCVGVGGSCPGGWQCDGDGNLTCPSWVPPAPDGSFFGTVRIDSNGNNALDAADAPFVTSVGSFGGVQKYPAICSGNPATCQACSPDPAYVGNCSSQPGIAGYNPTDSAGNYSIPTLGFEIQTMYFRAPTNYLSVSPNSVVVSTDSSATPGYTRRANFLIRSNNFNVVSNVRTVTDTSSCTSSSGNPYNGASLNLQGGTTNLTQSTNASGVTTFNAPPQAYTLSLQVPSGYSVVGRQLPSGGSASGTNGIQFTLSANTTASFCIALTEPWFQTDVGDVRFSSITSPIPSGKYASTGNQSSQYPGIYYSSDANAALGSGSVSPTGWLVNNEYSYNTDTQNRNGTVSYSFYKARAKTEGVTVTPLAAGTFNQNEITGSGVYEANGDLIIDSYTHTDGNRVVILANGNVTINTPISVPTGQGLFIIAAKENITISSNIGTAILNSTTSSLDGYYSAQGSIILPTAASCPTTPDRRLNIGGVLIANSLKPFAANGVGSVQNSRTLCNENLNYPSLYVASRLDFLTQLTDFYKIPYTKWKEERP